MAQRSIKYNCFLLVFRPLILHYSKRHSEWSVCLYIVFLILVFVYTHKLSPDIQCGQFRFITQFSICAIVSSVAGIESPNQATRILSVEYRHLVRPISSLNYFGKFGYHQHSIQFHQQNSGIVYIPSVKLR